MSAGSWRLHREPDKGNETKSQRVGAKKKGKTGDTPKREGRSGRGGAGKRGRTWRHPGRSQDVVEKTIRWSEKKK